MNKTIALCAVLLLAGCATSEKLEDNKYLVSFEAYTWQLPDARISGLHSEATKLCPTGYQVGEHTIVDHATEAGKKIFRWQVTCN
jgi:hypothetical protein